eukprot:5692346-Prymnesium_polylepis.1
MPQGRRHRLGRGPGGRRGSQGGGLPHGRRRDEAVHLRGDAPHAAGARAPPPHPARTRGRVWGAQRGTQGVAAHLHAR